VKYGDCGHNIIILLTTFLNRLVVCVLTSADTVLEQEI